MPSARTLSIEPFRDRITEALENGATQKDILSMLGQELGEVIGRSSPQRASKSWQVGVRPPPLRDEQALQERVKYLCLELRQSDAEAALLLKVEGFEVSKRRVRQVRRELGMAERPSKEPHEAEPVRATELLRGEYLTGDVTHHGYRKRCERTHSKHGIAGRTRLYHAARDLTGEVFEQRRNREGAAVKLPRQAHGPNHMWSMGAHCKFELWGIRIYGIIDVYSRYVVRMHVGTAGRVGTCALAQYVRCLRERGLMPAVLRADCGAETSPAGDAHHSLRTLIAQTRDEREPLFEETFRHDTSKQDQCIERYWGQQSKSMLNQWRQYFLTLLEKEQYNHNEPADRIAFLAVYMPILRRCVASFVTDHNKHSIRKQPSRPNAVQGIPEILYHHPRLSGTEELGYQVSAELLKPWEDVLEPFDMEEYLPPETLEWCENNLRANAFSLPMSGFERDARTQQRVHEAAYDQLRRSVQRHMGEGIMPLLEESYKPYIDDWREVLANIRLPSFPDGHIPDDMSYQLED